MNAGFALVGALGIAIPVATLALVFGRADAATCGKPIPAGRSLDAAWQTTDLFVADVLLNGRPGCGYDLSTEHLRRGHSRDDWANGRSPVSRFTTRYPPVPMVRASRNRHAHEAVYILSRRVDGFVVVDGRGRATIPMIVGLAAPDAGRGAYNLVLIVEGGSWRVDEVRRVHIVDEVRAAPGG
jgi:hypothetical protein